MNYKLVKDIINLVEEFEEQMPSTSYNANVEGFKQWLQAGKSGPIAHPEEPYWEGKEHGRSPESTINTLIVHMNRYAKTYSRSAISGSDFSTQEDFIYLITLKSFGAMGKMELIKRNIQDKPAGMKVIDRLLEKRWIEQQASETDRRSKIIKITDLGLEALDRQMGKIRKATEIVTGNLTQKEKLDLIRILQKLDDFHKPLYQKNLDAVTLLDTAYDKFMENRTK